MWGVQGGGWNGAYAPVNGDEWLYSAYIQALIDGRPRRNDPYTGRDDSPQASQPESLFSIQFVPTYLIVYPARVLGASASTTFIALGVVCPFLSSLAIFWLLWIVSDDCRFSAAATTVVLSFGALAAGLGGVTYLGASPQYVFLPFLRRYEPAAMFPLFFIFNGLVWKCIQSKGKYAFAWSIAAGFALDLLVFSYFYLWTSAVAWLLCASLLWLCAERETRGKNLGHFLTVAVIGVAALIPYLVLLSHRSTTMDSAQRLFATRAPDLFRIPELLGLIIVAFVWNAAFRGKVDWKEPRILFALSFALTPFVVFNQQIVTGRSLQPFHYEMFIANYVALIGCVLVTLLILRTSRQRTRPMGAQVAIRIIVVAVWWALIEVALYTNVILKESQFIDNAAAVCLRLREFSKADRMVQSITSDPRPLVFAFDERVAVILPTFAPQALLWSPNFALLDLQPKESMDRFYTYMYYVGIDSDEFAMALKDPMNVLTAFAFGPGRNLPDSKPKPISLEEITAKVSEYKTFCSSFDRGKAETHVLSYLIEPSEGADLKNLDRWYEREKGEQIGAFTLYRVRLR